MTPSIVPLRRMVLTLALAAGLVAPTFGQSPAPHRVVSAGGTVTEIVYALDQQSRLVGTDISSLYPAAATKLPQVGYVRSLAAEGLLSLAPDLLLTTVDAGPPGVINQIKGAGVAVSVVPAGATWSAAEARITFVAQALGVVEKGQALVAEFRKNRAAAEAKVALRKASPRVLFIYAHGAGTLLVSGTGTEAAAIVALAGGTNVVTGYQGYRPLTPEALAAARPDVVLMTTMGLESVGGLKGLAQIPGFSAAAAGIPVISLDDLLLLGFGPRLPQAITELEALWPQAKP